MAYPFIAMGQFFARSTTVLSPSSLELPQLFHDLFEVPIVDFAAGDMINPGCQILFNFQAAFTQHFVHHPNRDCSRWKEVDQLVIFAADSRVLRLAGGHDNTSGIPAPVQRPVRNNREKTHTSTALLLHARPNPVSISPTTPYSSRSSLPHRP